MESTKVVTVKRGYIYKWREGREDERFVLVVGSDMRGSDRAISILMFGTSSVGNDVVRINNKLLGDICYLHCGMVTYVNRLDMSDKPISQVSEEKMAEVDRQLCIQFGITNEDTMAELRFYKRKCNELIEKYTGVSCDL